MGASEANYITIINMIDANEEKIMQCNFWCN